MQKNLIKFGLTLTGLISKAHASGDYSGNLINPLPCDDFNCIATKIITYLQYIAAPLATVMVIVGGYQFLTSGGNPEKMNQGKKTLLYAAIGLAVTLIASGIKSIISDIFS